MPSFGRDNGALRRFCPEGKGMQPSMKPSGDGYVLPFRYAFITGSLIILFYAAMLFLMSESPDERLIFANLYSLSVNVLATLSLFYAAFHSHRCGNRAYMAWMVMGIAQLILVSRQ